MNRFYRAHFAALSFKNKFLLHNLVVLVHGQLLILYGRNLINFVAVKADPRETPVSCAKRLNDFRGLICSRASISRTFSSVSTILFDCLDLWPATFSQTWIHRTLLELASQDIHDETLDIFSVSFFPCRSFGNKHTPFNSELQFSINIDRLSTPLTQTDY
jgi:hypothetical protein